MSAESSVEDQFANKQKAKQCILLPWLTWSYAAHFEHWLFTISDPGRWRVSVSQPLCQVPDPLSSLINSHWQGFTFLALWVACLEEKELRTLKASWMAVWWLCHLTGSHPLPLDCRREQKRGLHSPLWLWLCLPSYLTVTLWVSDSKLRMMVLWACNPPEFHLLAL